MNHSRLTSSPRRFDPSDTDSRLLSRLRAASKYVAEMLDEEEERLTRQREHWLLRSRLRPAPVRSAS